MELKENCIKINQVESDRISSLNDSLTTQESDKTEHNLNVVDISKTEITSISSDDLFKIINEQRNEIANLNSKLVDLQEKVSMLKEEKEIITAEIRDMSGSLIEEAHKSIFKATEAKKALEDELNSVKQNESNLKIQNADLRALVEEMNKASSRSQHYKKPITHKIPTIHLGFNHSEKVVAIDSLPSKKILLDMFDSEITYNMNESYFDEFKEWFVDGCHPDTMFFKNILRDETYPCLSFINTDLQSIARTYMESWNANPTIENDPSHEKKVCDFTNKVSFPNYMVKFNGDKVYTASSSVRIKIISVVELYSYIRYISLGIVKSNIEEMFQEIIRLRVKVSLVRLGYHPANI